MHCNDEKVAKDQTISCGFAGECYYYCNGLQCNQDGTINAQNANNFYLIQTENANECLVGATLNLPNNGNAYLDSGRFKDMSVPAQTNIRVASHLVRSIDFGDMIAPLR